MAWVKEVGRGARVVRQCEQRGVGRGCPSEGYLPQGKLTGKYANGDHMLLGTAKGHKYQLIAKCPDKNHMVMWILGLPVL